MESLSKCLDAPSTPGATTAIATTALATIALMTLTRYALWPSSKPTVIRGPLTTYIPRLSRAEREKVTYSPDYYPGARDVVTPVGFPPSLCIKKYIYPEYFLCSLTPLL